jgi:hypothetical protein
MSHFAALAAALLASTTQPPAPVMQRRPAAQAPAPASVDARAIVQRVRAIIAERYVLPERRPALDAVLAEGLSSGRYAVSDPLALADRINADLARVGRDRHLNFSFDPPRAAILAAARGDRTPRDMSGFERVRRQRNHGVAELKLLPGNVRYMDYQHFDWIGDESRAALETALRFLSGGDAIIIDLRQNGGGNVQAVQYLISHFMEADRPLITFYLNGAPAPDRVSTLRELTLPRMIGKPLYVLTSDRTGSAAEEFVGHVAGYRLGELVGANTGGAGFSNDLVPLEGGFILSISVARAVLASTGKDWEAVGHAPTIAAPVERAREVAHAHALRRLAAAGGPDKALFEAMALLFESRARPVTTALPLQAYAGTYGERIILVEDGRLMFQRAGGPKLAMIAVGPNRFVIETDPLSQFEFTVAGASATGFELFRPDGSRATATRSN